MSHKNGFTPQCVRSQQRNLNVMGSFCAFELGSSVRDNRQMSYFSATIHLEGLLDLVYTLLLNNTRYTCSINHTPVHPITEVEIIWLSKVKGSSSRRCRFSITIVHVVHFLSVGIMGI